MKPLLNPSPRRAGALAALMVSALTLTSCADVKAPNARDIHIPAPRAADTRKAGINERPDSVTYLPLGDDVLVPQAASGQPLPSTVVGPFELRSETLAGALQLILDGTNIPIAFETTTGLDATVTVTDLKGPLDRVVHQVCSLANLYCSYDNGVLVVKETEVFTVAIPPIVPNAEVSTLLTNIASAVGNIVGTTAGAPITDASTRTIVYRATQRSAEVAQRYFQRLKNNTALVVFETYIWEVALDNGNSTGIRWDNLDTIGKFNIGLNLPGSSSALLGTPISIGLPTTGAVDFDTGDVLQFISDYGAVKTISQPQLTVLSGSSARLRVADTQNYVASISRTTTDGGNTTVSTSTDSVDSGFTLEIASNWDNATVYSNINILLQDVRAIDTFDENPDAVVQLPQTTERELQTQVRIRPGDSLLIAGLVRESDNFDKTGPGINAPILPISRTARTANTELVFLIRPRVIVFTAEDAAPRPGTDSTASGIPPRVSSDTTLMGAEPAQHDAVVATVAPLAEVKSDTSPAPVKDKKEPVPSLTVISDPSSNEAAAESQGAAAPAPVETNPLPVGPAHETSPSAQPVPLAPTPIVPEESTAEQKSSASSDPSVMIDYNVLHGR